MHFWLFIALRQLPILGITQSQINFYRLPDHLSGRNTVSVSLRFYSFRLGVSQKNCRAFHKRSVSHMAFDEYQEFTTA